MVACIYARGGRGQVNETFFLSLNFRCKAVCPPLYCKTTMLMARPSSGHRFSPEFSRLPSEPADPSYLIYALWNQLLAFSTVAIVGEGVFNTVRERSVVCTQMRVSGIPAIGILYSKNCRGQGQYVQ